MRNGGITKITGYEYGEPYRGPVYVENPKEILEKPE